MLVSDHRQKGAAPRGALTPFAPFLAAWTNRVLIFRLTRREIEARYRGSAFGLIWSLVVPALMLATYTFVFSYIFEVRWGSNLDNKGEFALLLFSGLIVFTIFSDCVNRAPMLMFENPTYIKKVVFPLEVMPWVSLLVALFNAGVSFLILIVFYLVVRGVPPWSFLLLPLVLLPLVLLVLGVTWFFASIGVFFRDLRQIIGVFTTLLLFLSPIFYPLSAVPESFRHYIWFNPLTFILEEARGLLFADALGLLRNWQWYIGYTLTAWLISWLGFIWFVKTKKGFADVM